MVKMIKLGTSYSTYGNLNTYNYSTYGNLNTYNYL